MNVDAEHNVADVADQHIRWTAVAILLASLKYFAEAAQALVGESLAALLDWVEIGCALAAVGVVFVILVSKHRRMGEEKWKDFMGPDSYLGQMFRQASTAALVMSWFAMIVLEILARGALAALPTEFFLQVTMAILLGTLGFKFMLLDRESDA